jgi:uncharacterized membrane protein
MQRRLQSVDICRGLAIVAMVVYHALWDLNYFGAISVGIGLEPGWMTAQRAIVTAFLLLSGASLWLAHGAGINWRGFWKREALLVAAALAVSLITWVQFGEYFAYFGILHAIALFSLMALPLLRRPVWVGAALALLVLLLPALWSNPAFNDRGLSWLGFFTETPMTADLVPVFPWFGVTLLGLLGMRLLAGYPALTWHSRNPALAGLAQLGRWSLWIYLVHQPILFTLLGWLVGNRYA